MGKRRHSDKENIDYRLLKRIKRLERKLTERRSPRGKKGHSREKFTERRSSVSYSRYDSPHSESPTRMNKSNQQNSPLQQEITPLSTDSSAQPGSSKQTDRQAQEDTTQGSTLDAKVLEILGARLEPKKGLPTEEKKLLIKKFPIPSNCTGLDSPNLNLESLSGAVRLLADVQFNESTIRRSLIKKNLDSSVRDILTSTITDEWLFGKELDEKIKKVKTLESSSKVLEPKTQQSSNRNSKNAKRPPRRPANMRSRTTASGQKFTTHRRSLFTPQRTSRDRCNQSNYRSRA
ncbi:hypothetical protein PUN28_008239 [Cardiocondyla obscurior]|uniref:Uncharacterized protein n=1 Tax=Cardiocondyla obscurior TaxID=286306 RepID=A0AAW2G1M8_9HYME